MQSASSRARTGTHCVITPAALTALADAHQLLGTPGQALTPGASQLRVLQGLLPVELPAVSPHHAPGQLTHPLEQREHAEALPGLAHPLPKFSLVTAVL